MSARSVRAARATNIGITLLVAGGLFSLANLLDYDFKPQSDTQSASAVKPEEAIYLPPRHEDVIQRYFQQSAMMLHAQQYDYAIKALHELLRLAPDMPEAHSNMGYALLGSGNAKAAGDFFETALELNSSLLNAYYGLALAYAGQEQWALAVGAMESYVHLQLEDDPFLEKGRVLLSQWRAQMNAP